MAMNQTCYALATTTEQITPLFHRVLGNINESRALATLRDSLLPKLISGELRVKDAERFVPEIAS